MSISHTLDAIPRAPSVGRVFLLPRDALPAPGKTIRRRPAAWPFSKARPAPPIIRSYRKSFSHSAPLRCWLLRQREPRPPSMIRRSIGRRRRSRVRAQRRPCGALLTAGAVYALGVGGGVRARLPLWLSLCLACASVRDGRRVHAPPITARGTRHSRPPPAVFMRHTSRPWQSWQAGTHTQK